MIRVTRLNGKQFVINAEMIETVDESPDTIITITQGHKFVVKESFDEIIQRVIEYKRLCHFMPRE